MKKWQWMMFSICMHFIIPYLHLDIAVLSLLHLSTGMANYENTLYVAQRKMSY